jgi:hypothetical protein
VTLSVSVSVSRNEMPCEMPVGGLALSRGVWLVLLSTAAFTSGRRNPARRWRFASNQNRETLMRVFAWKRAGGWRVDGAAWGRSRGPPFADYAQCVISPMKHREPAICLFQLPKVFRLTRRSICNRMYSQDGSGRAQL